MLQTKTTNQLYNWVFVAFTKVSGLLKKHEKKHQIVRAIARHLTFKAKRRLIFYCFHTRV